MDALLITHIGGLVNVREKQQLLRGSSLSELPVVSNAWLLVEGERIADYGRMESLPASLEQSVPERLDAGGGWVLPSWCDSHTHLVFAGSRESEFVDRLKGFSYAEIAAKGGGILESARKMAEMPEEELFRISLERLMELARMGTGAIEIKSGYGLSPGSELKMLRVIRRLGRESGLLVRSTFLGAHTYPPAFRDNHAAYLRQIKEEMLPVIAAEHLADYIDVFCEHGFFSAEETREILQAGKSCGLKPRVHANQLAVSGGVQAGVEAGALSVDHLESMDEAAIRCLASSGTIGTLLPGAAFFLQMQAAPAREMLEAGCAMALASDFNPGSCPSGNMNLLLSLACITMKMLPEEAINAATLNGAYAMELEKEVGSITKGKLANLLLTRPVSSLAFLPYSFGNNLPAKVMLRGRWL